MIPAPVQEFAKQLSTRGGHGRLIHPDPAMDLGILEAIEVFELPGGRFGVWLVLIPYGAPDVRPHVVAVDSWEMPETYILRLDRGDGWVFEIQLLFENIETGRIDVRDRWLGEKRRSPGLQSAYRALRESAMGLLGLEP